MSVRFSIRFHVMWLTLSELLGGGDRGMGNNVLVRMNYRLYTDPSHAMFVN